MLTMLRSVEAGLGGSLFHLVSMRAMGATAAVATAAVGLLTGCGSSGIVGNSASSAPPTETVPTAGSSSASSVAIESSALVPLSSRPAVTIDTSDSVGDKATVTVKVGRLSLVSDVANPIIQACGGVYDGIGTSPEQSVAIPVQLSATVTSLEAVSMIIVLDGTHTSSCRVPSPRMIRPASMKMPDWS